MWGVGGLKGLGEGKKGVKALVSGLACILEIDLIVKMGVG